MRIFSPLLTLILLSTGCNGYADTAQENEAESESIAQDQTTKDLLYAFAGESQANRKYTAFAEVADKEGYPGIARLWRAAAAAEAIHAKNHLKALGMIKSTQDNLSGAIAGEQDEFKTMYPKFIKTAEEAGKKEAATSMERAFKVEQLHFKMFSGDLADLKKGVKPADVSYWVCSVCGNTVPKKPPEKCEICGSPKDRFFEVK